ncbi:MAG: hypothetical protein AB8F94_10730 [Saprospiraceae bacterium]
MSDRLEKFINQNRDQFDDKVPNLKVWADIEKRLDPPQAKRISMKRILSIAASVLILLSTGAFLGNYFTAGVNVPIADLSLEDYPEYGKKEKDFQQEIKNKKAQLASFNYDIAINDDLVDLDKTLADLKTELKDVPKGSEEQVLQAMLKNYETKVAILEIVLKKIALTQTKRDKKNEGSEM